LTSGSGVIVTQRLLVLSHRDEHRAMAAALGGAYLGRSPCEIRARRPPFLVASRGTLQTPPKLWSPDDPDVLKVLADPHRVIPFLGAGMTLPAGLPDTAGLSAFLQGSELGRGIDFVDGTGLAETFNVLAAAHALADVRRATVDHLKALSAKARDVPPAYPHLVHIPSRWIVTLSYDTLLERAAREAQQPYQSVTWKETDRLNRLRTDYLASEDKRDELIIFHLHGSVDDPDSMVADRSGYRGVAEDGVVRNLLVALLSHHRACWMGSSLDEPYLVTLLGSLATGVATNCFISDEATVVSVRDAPRGRVSKSQHGMAYAYFPTGKWHHLAEFCQWLIAKQPVTSAPLSAGTSPTSVGPQVTATTGQPTRYVWSDWGPDWTRKALTKLGEDHPEELVQLQAALDTDTIEQLLQDEPGWLANGSWQLWVAAARFAEEHGNWPLSSQAWRRASSRPGADEARCLVGAAIAAGMTGDTATSGELLAAARKTDADHPRVLLQSVIDIDDPGEELSVLARLFDEEGDIGTLARCHAVIACLLAGDFVAAKTHLDVAESRGSDLLQVRLARINYVVHNGRTSFANGERADGRAVQTAKEDALALRAELLAQRRFEESCRLVMLAADATVVQGDLEDAAALLRGALNEEKASEGGHLVLADAALRAQDHAGALALLAPLPSSPSVDAMRAQAQINIGDDATRRAAWNRMQELLADADAEDHVADRCAHVLIFAANDLPDLPFPDAAADRIAAQGDTRGPIIARALWLHRGGHADEARELLHAQEPASWAFEAALQLALWEDDVDEIARLATRVLRDTDEPHLRLVCARQLAAAGDTDRSREVAAAIALDTAVAPRDRGDAFALLGHLIVERAGDHEEGLLWLRRWSEEVPGDRRHVWGRIQSLLRLGHHDEAIDLLLNTPVAIETRGEAMLAARAYLLMPDRMDGLARLADLLDSLPNRDPVLDQHAWIGLLHGGHDVPAELAERLRPSADFEIPGKQVTLDEMLVILRERQQTIDEVVHDVMAGSAAATKLAQAAGRELTTTWLAMNVKPAGFGTVEWAELERADAEHALTRGAVADPTGLVALTLLPDHVRATALRRLVGPLRIAQSTLDDVVEAAVEGVGTGQTIQYDADEDAPVAVEESEELLARRQAALDAVRDLGRTQRVEPDVRPDQPSRLDVFLAEDKDAPASVRALTASLVIAERTGRPLFSDDRVARSIARQLGLRAFGVASLLEALTAVNAVSEPDAADSMTGLRAHGYQGMPTLDGELARLLDAQEHNEPEIRRIVQDRMLWDAGGFEQSLRVLEVLHGSHEHDPARFAERIGVVMDWVTDATAQTGALRDTPERERIVGMTKVLTVICLLVTARRVLPGRFFSTLYVELESHASRRAGTRRGEIVEAAVQWLKENLGVNLTLPNFCQLPLWHQMRMVGVDPEQLRGTDLSDSALREALAQLPAVAPRPPAAPVHQSPHRRSGT
jgi:hypothetical protein